LVGARFLVGGRRLNNFTDCGWILYGVFPHDERITWRKKLSMSSSYGAVLGTWTRPVGGDRVTGTWFPEQCQQGNDSLAMINGCGRMPGCEGRGPYWHWHWHFTARDMIH
jgi:hypothetical protein